MFAAETYTNRRSQLNHAFQSGLLLLLGNDESPMNYADNTYSFRQDSTWLYYVGVDHAGLAAVIDVDAQQTTVFGNDLTIDDIVWTGPQPTIAELAANAGITKTAPLAALADVVRAAQAKGRTVHFLPPYRGEHRLQLAALLNMAPGQLAGAASLDLVRAVIAMRTHNHYHGHTLKSGDLFLLDAGAETSMHYAGDLTCTFPVDQTFTSRQKDVYQIVLDAHLAAVAAVKPGRPFREIHLLACRTLAEGLKGLGLMKGDLDDAVAEGAHAMFFQCGLGHMMGMDVHDMENLGEVWVGYDGVAKSTQFGLKSLRLARPLEPGFVMTVEPGLYFIPELMRRWKAEGKFLNFLNYDAIETFADFGGVRIEEDLLVTETGYRILGKPRPRTIAEVEAVRTR
jgi:Xaa-Pro aminopeptidase